MGISLLKMQAKKDAEEWARAKVSFGEGAGTRRKLIKETVKTRAKNPEYAKFFRAYLAKQDMDKHVKEAKKERFFKDATKEITKIAKHIWSSTGLSFGGFGFKL